VTAEVEWPLAATKGSRNTARYIRPNLVHRTARRSGLCLVCRSKPQGNRTLIVSISEAARAAGINRRTLQRAIQTGRLSATIDAAGGRGVDLAELIRAFGPLKEVPQETPRGSGAVMSHETAPHHIPETALVAVLHEQLQQAQQEKNRLMSLLETAQQVLQVEQQARRELEQKLLPAPPRPSSFGNGRLGVLLVLFALALAIAVAVFLPPDWLR